MTQHLATNRRVLVLDDSEVCLELCRAALERAGYDVHTAASPLGASRLVRETTPACVVVDVSMPALNGATLVGILRRGAGRELPILLHSDRPRAEIEALARESGATAAVSKTEDGEALVAAVRNALAKR